MDQATAERMAQQMTLLHQQLQQQSAALAQSQSEANQSRADAAHMLAQMQTMQQAHQQLTAQLAAVQSGVNSPSSSHPLSNSSGVRYDRPKFAPPKHYGGRAEGLDDWIGDIQQQVNWYHAMPAAEMMQFIASHLTGDAREWFAQLSPAPTTWADLQAQLRRRFQPITTAETSRQRLYSLVQGKASVSDFLSSFRRLLVHLPDMHPDDQLFQFMRALNSNISSQIRVHDVKTLAAAADMAVRISAVSSWASSSHPSSSGGYSSSSSAPVAMDLSNVEGLERETNSGGNRSACSSSSSHSSSPDDAEALHAMREQRSSRSARRDGAPTYVAHLTPEQVAEYRAAGKCFGCGSTNHQSRQCPKRKVDASTGRVSWSN